MRLLLVLITFFIGSNVAFATIGSEKKSDPLVTGTVLEAGTKKPIADVTITVIHATTKTEHTIFTDVHGNFKITQLPTGSYKFKFTKENYKSTEKANIVIKQELTTKMNVELTNDKDEDLEDIKNWNLKFSY
ncbi:MAG: carboxypeptidase-like regulatory domain-containing protein [Chitinophagaceae bacterium]